MPRHECVNRKSPGSVTARAGQRPESASGRRGYRDHGRRAPGSVLAMRVCARGRLARDAASPSTLAEYPARVTSGSFWHLYVPNGTHDEEGAVGGSLIISLGLGILMMATGIGLTNRERGQGRRDASLNPNARTPAKFEEVRSGRTPTPRTAGRSGLTQTVDKPNDFGPAASHAPNAANRTSCRVR